MARESQTTRARDTADSVPSMTSISTDDAGQLAQMRRALLEQQVRAAASHPATRPAAVTSRTASGPLPLAFDSGDGDGS